MKKLLFTLCALALVACRPNTAAPRPTQVMPPPTVAQPLTATPEAFDSKKLGTLEKDVVYCSVEGVDLKMDVYYPKVSKGLGLIYIHGGGWTGGDKADGGGVNDMPELNARGYVGFSINYRLAPQYKVQQQIEDVKCAVRSIRANAKLYGIDPKRIGAWGSSAGGHLVSLLGTSADKEFARGQYLDQSSRVQAVTDMFGPTDLEKLLVGPRAADGLFGVSDMKDPLVKKLNPMTHVTVDDPPFLIMHGDQDTTVPLNQSQIFYDALQKGGVPSEFVVVKNAEHSWRAVGQMSLTRLQITQRMADFFDQVLR